MNFLVYLHSLWLTHKVLHKIFEKNFDYETFYTELSFEKLKKYIQKDEQIFKILDLKKNLDTKNLEKKILNLWVKIITINDINYPKNLKQISYPPYLLYVRWELNGNDEFFSIVWSRKISNYAKKVGESIIPDLTKYFTIVSWWAWWCDTLVHKIAVDNNSKTVVVFWTWIDITYPSGNISLFEKVIETKGTIISIFPIGTPWSIYTFPIRNEIVSGISSWLLILEAWEKSWTLITANLSLDQWKNLFAIPWDIFSSNYIWTNNLIKNSSAKLVTSADDILEEYNYKIINTKKEIILENEVQNIVYNLLKYNLALSIDDILNKTQYEYWVLSLNLALLELNWIIKKDIFGKYGI